MVRLLITIPCPMEVGKDANLPRIHTRLAKNSSTGTGRWDTMGQWNRAANLPPERQDTSRFVRAGGISGVEFSQVYPRRVAAIIDGVSVDIIPLEDLKRNKKASGRHKDLADLENLP
jgi:hypothetical protein